MPFARVGLLKAGAEGSALCENASGASMTPSGRPFEGLSRNILWIGTAVASEVPLKTLPALLWLDEVGARLMRSSSSGPFSSASSVISPSRRCRSELVEEVMEPDAVCSMQVDESAFSVSSDGVVSEKTVS